ncbi:MAG TPA: PQQ-binding-like beta-propeller repeat protein [Solirubrobacterales bacterium]|jgi:uncharacterized repeat protein (TIGR02543 family)
MARLDSRRGSIGLALVTACAALCVSASAAVAEPIGAAADSLRTSWYPDEPQLTPQLLESGDFGLNFSVPVQGQVYAQPLVSGHTLLVATEKNRVYAINSQSGQVQWEKSFGTPWNAADLGCEDLEPDVGITGTPVIDPNTDVAYFLAKGYVSGSSGEAIWKMHAVSLADGEEQPGFPVTIAGEAENVTGEHGEPIPFKPKQLLQRPGLLLMNGVVYAAFGGNCDKDPFQGWIIGVSTAGHVTTRWTDAKGNGGSIWQSGGGLVSDGEGQIIFASGNGWSPLPGPGDEPREGNLGSAVVRLQVEPGGQLSAKDFFAPFNSEYLDHEDLDLGSGAPIALPSPYFGTTTTPHLLVQAGKAGELYLLNRDELGGRKPETSGENASLQELPLGGGVWASLATWPGDGGYVYVPTVTGSESLHFLKYATNLAGEPELTPDGEAGGFGYGSGSPIVTSNRTTPGSAVVWISRCVNPGECKGSVLDAYAAVPSGGTPKLLWSHEIGVTSKFGRAEAADGRVYVGTRSEEVLAFGALPHTLSVNRDSAEGGTVRSDIGGIDCGVICSHSYENGAAVTLTATPASGYRFTGWSEGCSGTGPCQVTMTADTEVTAHFAPITGPVAPITEPVAPITEPVAPITEPVLPETPVVTAPRHPNTSLRKTMIVRKRGTASFRLLGTASTERFQCKLVKPGKKASKVGFSSCGRSKTYRHLARGLYLFEARAINAAGPDPSPVRRRFRI